MKSGVAIPEAAFEFAARTRREDRWAYDHVTFTWTCPDNEHGHADGCTRLAAATTDWRAQCGEY